MLTIATFEDGKIYVRYLEADAASNTIAPYEMMESEIRKYANDNWASPAEWNPEIGEFEDPFDYDGVEIIGALEG